jgi:hypothetical protein
MQKNGHARHDRFVFNDGIYQTLKAFFFLTAVIFSTELCE